MFYFLTVICTISILDRYDIAKFEWRQLQKLLTFKSGGFAILIYSFTLIITLVTTKMDDKLSLYQHNSTLFNNMDDAVCIHTLIMFVIHTNTTVGHRNLEKCSQKILEISWNFLKNVFLFLRVFF